MGLIVCAIRGGPVSRATQDHAIELARAGGHQLAFLHVVEQSLVDLHSGVRSQAILEELRHLGEFIVAIAQERAQAAGVKAEGEVRLGHVPDEIIKYTRERKADFLVLGSSHPSLFSRLLHGDQAGEFAQRVQAETGATLITVPTSGDG